MESDCLDTLDVEGAADYLKVHKNTILKLINKRAIRAAKAGRRWVFFKADLARYLREKMEQGLLGVDHSQMEAFLFAFVTPTANA